MIHANLFFLLYHLIIDLIYEQQFQFASEEDREKAPIRFIPRMTYLGNG